MAIKIVEVTDKAGEQAFVKAAVNAQAGNRNWVRPFDFEAKLLCNPKVSPFAKQNEIARFVALANGEPVGRIAAIYDRNYLDIYNDKTGHFGMIEGIEDQPVFAELLKTAQAWLRQRGVNRITGPFSLSINHECGLQISGFTEPHVSKVNCAQPYYRTQIEKQGYQKLKDLAAYKATPADAAFGIARVKKKWGVRSVEGLSIRGSSQWRWSRDFARMIELYNRTWNDNWGAVPIDEAERKFLANVLRPFVFPKWLTLAEYNGELIGMLSLIPDINTLMPQLNGRLGPISGLNFFRKLYFGRTMIGRGPATGVHPKFRGTPIGIAAIGLMMTRAFEIARDEGMEFVEMSWVLEDNRPAINGIKTFGGKEYKRFRIFEKYLD